MPKYRAEFTTTIRGTVIIEAANQEEANEIAEGMAEETVDYDDMHTNGRGVPNVETEYDDLMEIE